MGTPQVTPINERRHDGGYVVWEPSDGIVTRYPITLLTGFSIVGAGTVLGMIGHGLTATAAVEGTNTGNPTFGTITIGDPAIAGVYVFRMQDATHFVVEDPNGVEIGHGVLGTAFSAGGLGFTATAGGTACVPGDTWTITVPAGSGLYVPWDPTGNDGREFVKGILFGTRDTTTQNRKAVAHLQGPMRVNSNELVWGANVTTTPQQQAAIAALAQLPGGGIQAT